MQYQRDYLLPDLIAVEERADLRRAPRVAPGDLQVELSTPGMSHPVEGHCLNLSEQGIALLCDIRDISVGDPVRINLWRQRRSATRIRGSVVRFEASRRFTRLAIEFDDPHFTKAAFRAILED